MGYVGQPVERFEDLRLLRGRGQYVDDVHVPGMLHASILRSSVAHGRIRSIDTHAARAMPGVHAVLTAADIARDGGPVPTVPLRLLPVPEAEPFEQPVIAQHKVRYVGEPIALVLAESLALAEDAAEAIELDIEPLPAVPDWRASVEKKALLFEAQDRNVVMSYTASKGDALKATGPYVRKERFSVQRHSAVTMEPRGLLAIWDGAKTKLTVMGAAKVPFQCRRTLSKNMDLPEECIDMIENDVGGGFGVRGEFYPEDFLIPFAARRANRPVKWIEDRRENLLAANHSREMESEVELVCERDGRIVAVRGKVWVDMGAYFRANGSIPARNVTQFLTGPYRVPNVHVESYVCLTNKCPVGTYRGPGRYESDFFRERLFDMAARDLGIDPVEFRKRNLPSEAEMPYAIATARPPEKKEELDSGDYVAALERCLAEFGWEEKKKLAGRQVDGRYHGIALGCYIEGGATGPRESAKLQVGADGRIVICVGSTSVGQGVETVMLQIAADALGVPMESLGILHGSTTAVSEGFGSYHSRATVMGGSALLLCAEALKKELRARAAAKWGCAPESVAIGEGLAASHAGKTLALKALAGDGITVEETYANTRHTYSYGTAAAHVTVDPRTGQVRVLEYLVVQDMGRIINPLLANGQLIGALVQGLGGAFLEHFQYDADGQFLTASLADYLLPSATDFPNLRGIAFERHATDIGLTGGAKGASEGGLISVGGVIGNAIASALRDFKVEPRALPLSPPRVWQLIREAGRS